MNVGDQMSLFDQDLWFSKMSRDCFPQTEVRTSEPCLKKRQGLSVVTPQFLDCRTGHLGLTQEPFWEMDGLLLGEYTTVSFGESPNAAVECHLSQILEDNPLPKYSLSGRACQGILNRAKKQGKALPKILEEALMQSVSESEQGVTGGVKASLSKTEKSEPSQRSTTNTSSMVQIEGNGSRPSHHGDGYCESDIAYTLNATEHHAVAFSQGAYDKYSTSDVSATLKQSGGNYGGVRKR